MSILKTNLCIIFLISIICFTTGCNNKFGVEIALIDSVMVKNKRTMDNLNIDLVTINTRKLEIKKQLDVLQNITPDSSAMEYKMNYDKYKGIYKVYSKFIDNYDVIINRVKFNDKQLSTLKNSVIDEKINGTDFKIALEKEKANAEDNFINSQTIGQRIFQLEPDYQRLSGYFEKQVSELIKKYPELIEEK